jgi:hypothetical protein
MTCGLVSTVISRLPTLDIPMTTKFAAFFRFFFLYSATTSRFLLLNFAGSRVNSLTAVSTVVAAADVDFVVDPVVVEFF